MTWKFVWFFVWLGFLIWWWFCFSFLMIAFAEQNRLLHRIVLFRLGKKKGQVPVWSSVGYSQITFFRLTEEKDQNIIFN